MINRENWKKTEAFLKEREKMGRDRETVHQTRRFMRHLLEWAGEVPFEKARSIDPSFQTYLLTARNDGKTKQLSAASMKKACEYARVFLRWAKGEFPLLYRNLSLSWIDTIRPGTAKGLQSEYHEHEFWSLEDVRKIAALRTENVKEERDQAAVCFLFLSAMRAAAFVSLPVKAVDLQRYLVRQFPEMGVHTKNAKAAKTQVIRLPDLLAVVQAWDRKVRELGCDLWYPRIDAWHRFVSKEVNLHWDSRTKMLNRGIQALCERAGIGYLSAHKLRHGHTVYMMRRVKDMKGLKVLSQNLMHSSVAITDGIYGRLVNDDMAEMYEEVSEE